MEHDKEKIQEVRKQSKVLITIGACATAGGVQALRNFANVEEYKQVVYARPEYIHSLAKSTPISDHVKVDYELKAARSTNISCWKWSRASSEERGLLYRAAACALSVKKTAIFALPSLMAFPVSAQSLMPDAERYARPISAAVMAATDPRRLPTHWR